MGMTPVPTTRPARPRPKVLALTDTAASRIRDILEKSERPLAGLRIGVKNGGCAGMEYTMEWAEEKRPFDEVVEDKGVEILIDAKAVLFLLGTEMDYEATALKSGFVFRNPNQTSACGCGESVALKPAEALA
jgi:iron-sulfur cluster assembly protein